MNLTSQFSLLQEIDLKKKKNDAERPQKQKSRWGLDLNVYLSLTDQGDK